ncbi:extracellular lipase [Hortaea werneckii]|uniref:Fungal lipase-type domain-containing protein n=1 Tax=Hortaea werneckii TaxID=91943 RepID=A0A3M7H6T7_HORWE|nr:extracellular lipase [Hortaea werneckii]KAI7564515.1 extracellular lipase [Hortaea werneckii]KAI7615024.1 extracellular lipase [Hortaea werneckii]KAI7615413.1 extracellular lipase [Hortaea werneckii]KAI7655539.1 extracellular lipase [Hortaea werneckii]
MRLSRSLSLPLFFLLACLDLIRSSPTLGPHNNHHHPRKVSAPLFSELEELARIVDVTYCSPAIAKPFTCLSRCKNFPHFELVTTWDTGPLLSDSAGYIALDHGRARIIVAFRGTYSLANTVADLSTIPQKYEPYPGEGGHVVEQRSSQYYLGKTPQDGFPPLRQSSNEDKCHNCTVHAGFQRSWSNTRAAILPHLHQQLFLYPDYALNLVGHSLGGAVAALAGLEMLARGADPTITTYGEPRVGNRNLAEYIDRRFGLLLKDDDTTESRYRRVTHIDDPVPLLPLTEWGYAAHAGEIFIAKKSLSPDVQDLRLCERDDDPDCIAGQDGTTVENTSGIAQRRDLLGSVKDELQQDVITTGEPRWGGIPARYRLWELFFAHRDYFWRLGLCVPGGDPLGGGGKYP